MVLSLSIEEDDGELQMSRPFLTEPNSTESPLRRSSLSILTLSAFQYSVGDVPRKLVMTVQDSGVGVSVVCDKVYSLIDLRLLH